MNIDEAFYRYLDTNWTFDGAIRFGSAEGTASPYVVMLKVADEERPQTLCEDQGDTGEALLQFSGHKGGAAGEAASAATVVQYVEPIKKWVATIIGAIGTTPDDYMITNNTTSGVRLISEGASTTGVWGVLFETTITWTKI